MSDLKGRIAVVTGGARGIGRAIVDQFVRDGASVAILDIDGDRGTAAERDYRSRRDLVIFTHCDVGREADVMSALDTASRRLGPVSILVNNAGVNTYFDATAMSVEDWDRVFDVDLKGAWICAKHVIPSMIAAHGGAIINISSIHAYMSNSGMFPYAVAKSGLLGLTRSLALDYAPYNVRVNSICPGFIRTALVEDWLNHQADRDAAESSILKVHPLGRLGSPEDVAALAGFLASDQASFITGTSILVDGGLSARFAT